MNLHIQKYLRHRLIIILIFSCVVLFSQGCVLFGVDYWVHRLDDASSDQDPASLETDTAIYTGPENDSTFGSKCVNSPGTAPCPIAACVVYEGQYTAKNVVTSELFGKANPTDYQCCAHFELTNNSGMALMGWEHSVTESDDNWYFQRYPIKESQQQPDCSNYFGRKDGQETFNKGTTEIIVIYDNPHCEWIQWNEPGLAKYRVPVELGCYQN